VFNNTVAGDKPFARAVRYNPAPEHRA
jgi:hypothetical protein